MEEKDSDKHTPGARAPALDTTRKRKQLCATHPLPNVISLCDLTAHSDALGTQPLHCHYCSLRTQVT